MSIKTKSNNEVKLAVGICMDINPYEFKSNFNDMEFSTFCKEKNADAIVFLTNWTESEEDINSDGMNTLNYWAMRCSPLLKSNKPVYFLAADRTGKEKKTFFVGNSCIIKMCNKPKIINRLNKYEQNTIYASLNI